MSNYILLEIAKQLIWCTNHLVNWYAWRFKTYVQTGCRLLP
jgi:hypothetical protein